MKTLEEVMQPIIVPHGYGGRVARATGFSMQTINEVSQGRNKNPVTRMKVKKTLDRLIEQDFAEAEEELKQLSDERNTI